MNSIEGNYTEDNLKYKYVCRVFLASKPSEPLRFINGVGAEVPVQDTDILKLLGQETWFALYRETRDPLKDVH